MAIPGQANRARRRAVSVHPKSQSSSGTSHPSLTSLAAARPEAQAANRRASWAGSRRWRNQVAGIVVQVRIGENAIGTAEAPASTAQIQSTVSTPAPCGEGAPGQAGHRHDSEDKQSVAGQDCPEPLGRSEARDDASARYGHDHDEEGPPERGRAEPESREPRQDRGPGESAPRPGRRRCPRGSWSSRCRVGSGGPARRRMRQGHPGRRKCSVARRRRGSVPGR